MKCENSCSTAGVNRNLSEIQRHNIYISYSQNRTKGPKHQLPASAFIDSVTFSGGVWLDGSGTSRDSNWPI